MMEETAQVIKTEPGFAWVRAQRQATCGHCSVRQGCGTGVIGNLFSRRLSNIRALNRAGAEEGDYVIVGLQESSLLKSALISYLLPLVLMLVGAVVAESFQLTHSELGAIFGAVVGLLLAWFLVRRFARHIVTDPNYQPVILRKAGFVEQIQSQK